MHALFDCNPLGRRDRSSFFLSLYLSLSLSSFYLRISFILFLLRQLIPLSLSFSLSVKFFTHIYISPLLSSPLSSPSLSLRVTAHNNPFFRSFWFVNYFRSSRRIENISRNCFITSVVDNTRVRHVLSRNSTRGLKICTFTNSPSIHVRTAHAHTHIRMREAKKEKKKRNKAGSLQREGDG